MLDHIRISTECKGMEDTQGAYSEEDEIKGMDVHMGIEGTNLDGHGEGKEKNMNMVETIKNL
jgi:hypothetical protein